MTPALAKAGFQVQVFHVFTATALPKHVVSSREHFSLSPSGVHHGSSTSTDGNASMCRFRGVADGGARLPSCVAGRILSV